MKIQQTDTDFHSRKDQTVWNVSLIISRWKQHKHQITTICAEVCVLLLGEMEQMENNEVANSLSHRQYRERFYLA